MDKQNIAVVGQEVVLFNGYHAVVVNEGLCDSGIGTTHRTCAVVFVPCATIGILYMVSFKEVGLGEHERGGLFYIDDAFIVATVMNLLPRTQ